MIRGKCTDYSRCACVACWLDPNVAKASDGLEEARSYFRNIRCADCSFGTSVTRNEKVYKVKQHLRPLRQAEADAGKGFGALYMRGTMSERTTGGWVSLFNPSPVVINYIRKLPR